MKKEVTLLEANGIDGGGPLDPDQVEPESRSSDLYQYCPTAYQEWCQKYGKEPDTIRFATFSNNYVAMREYAQNAGKELKLNKYADCTTEEYSRIINGPSPDETSRQKAAEEANIAIERAEAARLAERQVAEQMKATEQQNSLMGDNKMTTGGSQVGEYQDQSGQPIRPTQVVRKAEEPRKTKLINDAQSPVQPNQVVKRDEPPVRPTEVIKPAEPSSKRRTIYIPEASSTAPPRSTQVIKVADPPPVRPTEVI
jgi:hypothetical protein